MKNILIFSMLFIAGFTHPCDLSSLEKAKQTAIDFMVPCIYGGAGACCVGNGIGKYIATYCPASLERTYDITNVYTLLAKTIDETVCPSRMIHQYVQACAEGCTQHSSYAGTACAIIPVACLCALTTYECCENECWETDDAITKND